MFLNYNIFPSGILNAYSQWLHEGREMKDGDTIVQQIKIPPYCRISIRFIAGVRIKEVFNSNKFIGFSYETLQGHAEQGISIFKIEEINNKLVFSIETYSKPAVRFLKFFNTFPIWYQEYCTIKALKHIKKYYS